MSRPYSCHLFTAHFAFNDGPKEIPLYLGSRLSIIREIIHDTLNNYRSNQAFSSSRENRKLGAHGAICSSVLNCGKRLLGGVLHSYPWAAPGVAVLTDRNLGWILRPSSPYTTMGRSQPVSAYHKKKEKKKSPNLFTVHVVRHHIDPSILHDISENCLVVVISLGKHNAIR
jgi:hypothetical protein